jgi:hypothetical protein
MTKPGHFDRQPDPTPEEIQAACLRFQAGWQDGVQRAYGHQTRPVDPGIRVYKFGFVHQVPVVDPLESI